MTRKSQTKPDDPEQSHRFKKVAREAEADEDPQSFEKVFKKVVVTKSAPSAVDPARKETK